MKRVLLGLSGVAGLALVAALGGYLYVGSAASARLAQTYEVEGVELPVPFPLTDAEVEALRQERLAADPTADPLAGVDLAAIAQERAVARAEAMLTSRIGCGDCHGMDGAGKLVADAMPVWKWYAPNITSGGVTKAYTVADWDRIVRHGVKPDGTPATMPSADFESLSDRELSDVIAYYRSRAPIAAPQPVTELGPVGKVLIGLGQMPLSAELIDHAAPHLAEPPPAGATVEYGKHLAGACVGCHRQDFSGGPILQGPPDWPPAGNLTPHGEGLAGWTLEEFVRVFREGKNRDGSEIRPPMAVFRQSTLSDVELQAMFSYFQSIEAKPTGT